MKSYESIIGVLKDYGIEDIVAIKKAATAISSGAAEVIAVTGRMGAGKDATAPPVLLALGRTNIHHIYFAEPLKREVTAAMELIRSLIARGESAETIIQQLSEFSNIPMTSAKFIVTLLWDELSAADGPKDAWSRTPAVRRALQHWGTDIRRVQDPNYWVKQVVLDITKALASGESVFVTDARFPNEADALNEISAFVVWLEVTRDTQIARIIGRDGIVPTEEALTHVSETALDGYGEFDLILRTDDMNIEQVVGYIADEIKDRRGE